MASVIRPTDDATSRFGPVSFHSYVLSTEVILVQSILLQLYDVLLVACRNYFTPELSPLVSTSRYMFVLVVPDEPRPPPNDHRRHFHSLIKARSVKQLFVGYAAQQHLANSSKVAHISIYKGFQSKLAGIFDTVS